MATKVEGLIQKVNPGDNVKYSIASTAYGYCQTAAVAAAKVVDMTGFTLLEGTTIHVKFQYANTAANPTLNVNGTGAKNIVLYGTEKAGTAAETSGWQAGAVVSLTYDGTSWVRDQGYNTNATSDNTKVAKTGDTMSGTLTMSKNGEIGVEVENTAQAHKVAYIVGSSGNGGIYDRTHSKWVVYSTTAGHVELNGHAGSATYAASALNATHSSSAGYAASAARATYAMSAASAGYAASAAQATHATSANYAANATNATEAVHAATAGYASSAGYANAANTANTSGTASWAVTANNAKTALTATEAVHAASAGYALHSGSAGYAASAAQATHAASAGYANSAGAVAWDNITGKPSSFTPSSHTHYELATIGDQRNVATTPDTYKNRFIFQGLKGKATINNPSTDTYSYLLGLRGWSDASGGDSHELAFNNTGIYWRHGATATWGSWNRLVTNSGNWSIGVSSASWASSAGYAASAAQATHAASAGYAVSAAKATNAASAGYATNAGAAVHAASAGYAASALNATHAASAGYALYSASAGYALHSSSAGYAASAAQATHAASAGYALKSGSAGYAASAAQATHAASAGYAEFVGKGSHTAVVAANEFTPSVGSLTIVGNVNNTSMSHTNNANAEMIIKAHPTSGTSYYEARLGFSSNGSLYYMPVNDTAWKTIAYTTSDITGKSGSAGYAASAAQATHAASAGYAVSASQATHSASAGYSTSAAQATHSASAGYASSAARATYAAKAALTTTAGAVAFYSDTAGTFANDADFLWDSTNNKLTAANLNGYVMAGQKANTTLGSKATAEGQDTTASGNWSHAEGKDTTASGNYSHAEGYSTIASGYYSHAEGNHTTTSGTYAHAEGYFTKASGTFSHAEGSYTTASGDYSHAEGESTIASGQYSHAEGQLTIAQRRSQHVFGEYNILDTTGTTSTRGKYIEIVGNGTTAARANARTLDWSGNEWLAGGLTTPKLIGSGETLYGETLPETGSEGQVFFQLSDGYIYELPTGGAVDEMLVKNSATDRDVKWTRDYVKRTGDTMTGQLIVDYGNATVLVTDATTRARAYVQAASPTNGGRVGINTYGYWDGSAAQTGWAWLIYRGTDGSGHTDLPLWGAVWNDYAECRETKEDIEPGRCIRELGDDSLELTTERLQRGCEIVSDTFGFAIGKTEKAKTPTAASGRVLAYLYEDRELAKEKIGWPVCSGPNGTVSIMTEEEEQKYPSRIIGTISAVPDYEVWHGGNDGDAPIQVNGRIWIRIR